MTTAVLSIGANQGDRLAALRAVVAALPGARPSAVYETAPWGPVPQPDYLNAVLIASGEHDWLAFAHRCEALAGRVRAERWGPRPLDVDIVQLTADDGTVLRSTEPDLLLPHPRAAERAFVLVPWLDVDPDAVLAGAGPVADLVKHLDTAGVQRTAHTLEVAPR